MGVIPDEFREYQARQLFGLSEAEYDAMNAEKLDRWFAFNALQVKAQKDATA